MHEGRAAIIRLCSLGGKAPEEIERLRAIGFSTVPSEDFYQALRTIADAHDQHRFNDREQAITGLIQMAVQQDQKEDG